MKYRILAVLFHVFSCGPYLCRAASDATVNSQDSLINDPELLNAMEIFMGMSAQERHEMMQGLMEAVGHDPANRKEMETLIKMLPQMDDHSNLQQMIREDELNKARQEASRQLEGQDWGSFWAMQAEILEATIASGQLTPEQAAHFKTNEDAWKAQLRIIFDDLQKQGHGEL